MSTNAQYAATMRAKLKRWDADFDALAALVAKAHNDARHEGIEALRASRAAAQMSVDEIRFASESAGARLKAQMEASWGSMRKALECASADCKKNESRADPPGNER